ncbi:MAG: energy transducer TonB [Acidobacteriota bacterium]
MKQKMFVLLLALLLVASQASALSAVATDALYCEAMLRERIVKRTILPYPRQALDNGAQGRVIVAVVFDQYGDLSKVEVLEAPHPSTKQAVIDTLKDWKAARMGTSSGPINLVGWLSFDFSIQGGVGHVEYAERSNDDDKPDKRYIHPFIRSKPPFYYQYQFGG